MFATDLKQAVNKLQQCRYFGKLLHACNSQPVNTLRQVVELQDDKMWLKKACSKSAAGLQQLVNKSEISTIPQLLIE